MKRIAIITFHENNNFGAHLQMYGLYRKLNDIGYDCHLLNYRCERVFRVGAPHPLKFTWNLKNFIIDVIYGSQKRKKYKKLLEFQDKYVTNKTKQYDIDSIKSISENFDAYIVGSDMVWGLDVTDHDYTYFLDFVQKTTKKLTYGSSIGKDWTEDERKKIANLLEDFEYLSVRETETADQLERMIGKRPDVVSDPTMLLTSKEWMPFVAPRQIKEKYVVVYFNSKDNKAIEDAKLYAQTNKCKVYMIGIEIAKDGYKCLPAYSIENFLSLIYHAEAVFTASYHGMLFSLYFHKELYYYLRHPESRMLTAANRLGVEERDATKVDIFNMKDIDYTLVDQNLKAYRDYSINQLANAINS